MVQENIVRSDQTWNRKDEPRDECMEPQQLSNIAFSSCCTNRLDAFYWIFFEIASKCQVLLDYLGSWRFISFPVILLDGTVWNRIFPIINKLTDWTVGEVKFALMKFWGASKNSFSKTCRVLPWEKVMSGSSKVRCSCTEQLMVRTMTLRRWPPRATTSFFTCSARPFFFFVHFCVFKERDEFIMPNISFLVNSFHFCNFAWKKHLPWNLLESHNLWWCTSFSNEQFFVFSLKYNLFIQFIEKYSFMTKFYKKMCFGNVWNQRSLIYRNWVTG